VLSFLLNGLLFKKINGDKSVFQGIHIFCMQIIKGLGISSLWIKKKNGNVFV
jgi:hypothetical protein